MDSKPSLSTTTEETPLAWYLKNGSTNFRKPLEVHVHYQVGFLVKWLNHNIFMAPSQTSRFNHVLPIVLPISSTAPKITIHSAENSDIKMGYRPPISISTGPSPRCNMRCDTQWRPWTPRCGGTCAPPRGGKVMAGMSRMLDVQQERYENYRPISRDE